MSTFDEMLSNPYSTGLFANPTMYGPVMAAGPAINYLSDRDIGGSGNFFGNRDRITGAIASGGLSEVARGLGKALGFGGGRTPYVAPTYKTGSTYGRPQDRFSMEEALFPAQSDAPTRDDYYSDMYGQDNVSADGFLLDEQGNMILRKDRLSGRVTPARAGAGGMTDSSDMAALYKQANDPSLRWTDSTPDEVGGKSAYRYSWEQPGYQSPSNMLYVNQSEANTLKQSAPKQRMSSPQPLSIETTNEGWGFGGNNAPATFGSTANPFYNTNTQSFNNPTEMLWQNNSIPEESRPIEARGY